MRTRVYTRLTCVRLRVDGEKSFNSRPMPLDCDSAVSRESSVEIDVLDSPR